MALLLLASLSGGTTLGKALVFSNISLPLSCPHTHLYRQAYHLFPSLSCTPSVQDASEVTPES